MKTSFNDYYYTFIYEKNWQYGLSVFFVYVNLITPHLYALTTR